MNEENKEDKKISVNIRIITTKEGKVVTIPKGESFDLVRKGSPEPYLRILVVDENDIAIILDPLKFGNMKEG